jgi:hypothetical protein
MESLLWYQKEKRSQIGLLYKKTHNRTIWADTRAVRERLRELRLGVDGLHSHRNTIRPAGVIPAGHICASEELMRGQAGFYQAWETPALRYVPLAVFRPATV